MPRITYHLLTEAEPFSEFSGGAISRWAGNVLRSTSHFVVVCPDADGTWNFAQDSIRVLPAMAAYKHLRRHLQHLPWVFHCQVIRDIFRPFLKRVRSARVRCRSNPADSSSGRACCSPFAQLASGEGTWATDGASSGRQAGLRE
jgi:hypothetical protein